MLRNILIASIVGMSSLSQTPAFADSPPVLQLPDTTPPGKPHFDNKGAMVGDQLPGFAMHALDGKVTTLEQAWTGGPTLLLTSSYTCPKSRATYPQAAELAKRVAAQGIHAAIIYVIEAHPAGDPSPYTGKEEITPENEHDKILCRQPITLEQRLKLANDFSARFRTEIPIFVDEMNNQTWSMLGGGPNMGVLVDQNGIVLARQGWFDARSMEQAIQAFVAAIPKKTPEQTLEEFSTESTLGRLIESGEEDALKALLTAQPELLHLRLSSYGDPSLLQVAAGNGKLNIVKLLVERGADVKEQHGESGTALHWAASSGNNDVIRFLIEHGADVNAKIRGHGPTPLEKALSNKQAGTAEILLKAGAKPDFFTAAATGDIAALRHEFLREPTVLCRLDGDGQSALFYAAINGKIDVEKFLVSLGARDYPIDGLWKTAIYHAVHDKNLDLLRFFLDSGFDANQMDLTIVPGLPIEFTTAMLDHKADVNHPATNGLRPIHAAVAYDRLDIAKLLLEKGADIDSATTGGNMMFCGPSFNEGDTALHIAAENRKVEMLEFLLQRGAKVNLHNEKGRTPLHDAISGEVEDAEKMIGLLLAHHAEINAVDKEGHTPLDDASMKPDPSSVFGDSAAHDTRMEPVIELLKKRGAVKGKPTAATQP